MFQFSKNVIMANLSSNIFARLETLRKWQEEQQERLLKQKSDQEDFLSFEQKRLNEALDCDKIVNSTPISKSNKLEPILEVSTPCIDDKEIIPHKDFNELLNEKLTEPENDIVKETNMSKPKKPFLKKGTGLARFRMSNNSLPNSTLSNKKSNIKTTNENDNLFCVKSGVQEIIQRASWAQVLQKTESPRQEHSLEQSAFEQNLERALSLKNNYEGNCSNSEKVKNIKIELQSERANNPNVKRTLLDDLDRENYAQQLKNELKNESKRDLFIKDILENDKEINKILGRDINTTNQDLDELRIFELLEEKALNSSFCSTSSVIHRLIGKLVILNFSN